MAASISKIMKLSSSVLKLSRLFVRLEPPKLPVIRRYNAFRNYFLLSLVPVATVSAESWDQPFEPNDTRLRSSECLKNAAGLAVDSTSAVLSQTVYTIIKLEKEYVELLKVLATLLEYQVEVLGEKAEEERIADIVLETRHEINKVKKRKQDLAILFASVEKLADAAAEVAFATGCSYASTSAGERLYSAQQEVRRKLADSDKAERDVAYVEAQMIAQLTQMEEKMRLNMLEESDNDKDVGDGDMEATEMSEVEESDSDSSRESNKGEKHNELEVESVFNDGNGSSNSS